MVRNSETEKSEKPGEMKKSLRPFQILGAEFLSANRYALLADEPGCISGDAVLSVNRGGKGFKVALEDAYLRFNCLASRRNHHWDSHIPTYCRALCEGELRQHRVLEIVYKGKRQVVKLELKSGKNIFLTPDHLVRTSVGWWQAGILRPGDAVLINGAKTYNAGSSNWNWNGGRTVDADGYVLVWVPGHHRARKNYVYEHIIVAEKMLGREINWPEQVHHINEDRADNRPENLRVLSPGQHHREHHKHLHLNGGKGGKGGLISFVPKIDEVVSVLDGGTRGVYDIVMEAPHHNFVANGVIVHNCGKTLGAIQAVENVKAKRIAVACPASVRLNWRREVKECGADNLFWDIRSYEGWVKESKSCLSDLVEYDVAILDECHFAKTPSAARAKAIYANKTGLVRRAKRVWGLSGTPVLNRPRELWTMLKVLAVERIKPYDSYDRFARRYCGAFYDGYTLNDRGASNLSDLASRLSGFMLRRTKKEVLPQLPGKILSRIPLEIGTAERRSIEEAEKEIGNREAFISSVMENYSQLGDSSRLLRITGEAKVRKAVEFVEDLAESAEGKIVVFARHREVVRKLAAGLGVEKCVEYVGGMSDKDKDGAIDRFVADHAVRYFVGNIQAAGTGINGLQKVSNDVVFAELSWVPGEMGQAIDRVDRMGKSFDGPVNAYLLYAPETLEEAILSVHTAKNAVIERLVGGAAL